MYSRNQTPTPSRTSPRGGRRGCLCKDGTYNSKCCNGDLQNQGSRQSNRTECRRFYETRKQFWFYNVRKPRQITTRIIQMLFIL